MSKNWNFYIHLWWRQHDKWLNTYRHSLASELSLLFALLLWLLSNSRRRPFDFLHLLCGFAVTGLRFFLQWKHRKQWSPSHFTNPPSQWVNTMSAGNDSFFFHSSGWIWKCKLLNTGSYWYYYCKSILFILACAFLPRCFPMSAALSLREQRHGSVQDKMTTHCRGVISASDDNVWE